MNGNAGNRTQDGAMGSAGDGAKEGAAGGAENTAPSRSDQASDRTWGPMWVVLGAAMTVGALRIDRLESQGVEWFAAPGLLPGVLGVIIMLNGLLIALRARRMPAGGVDSAHDWRRIGLTLVLCLGFAAGLVGRGMHFGVAAGLYLFSHIALLQWNERKAAGQAVRGLLVAAAVAVGGALIVPYIFESVFLVRLP